MTITKIDRLNGVTDGVAVKAACRVATTANITLSGVQTVDGVLLAELDRVLVKDQTDTTLNGIYSVSTGLWTRTTDFNGSRDIVYGTLVYVNLGTVGANSIWVVSTVGAVVGSALSFSNYIAGAGQLPLAGGQMTGFLRLTRNFSVTATGTVQGDATALIAQINVITGGAVNTGVIVPATGPVWILNASGSTKKIYPPSGDNLNALSANVADTLANNGSVMIDQDNGTQWYTF